MATSIAIVVMGDTPSSSAGSISSVEYTIFYNKITHTWQEYKDGNWLDISVPAHLHPEIEQTIEALSSVYAPISHSHPTHGDINFTGTVSANGDEGITGQKTIGGYKITFKKGLLTGFEPV